jgi:hypothetical protein
MAGYQPFSFNVILAAESSYPDFLEISRQNLRRFFLGAKQRD